jgi:hypothetical protein
MKLVGKPDADVRFDERGWETERCQSAPSNRAHPRLYISEYLSRERIGLLRLDARGLHHLAPLLGFVGDEFLAFGG